jgi:hypothetical protein
LVELKGVVRSGKDSDHFGYNSSEICAGRETWVMAVFKPLRTLRPIYRTGVRLTSRGGILYIFFSANISIENFKHAAHSSFYSSKCRLFHNATFFGFCIIHILHTECANI